MTNQKFWAITLILALLATFVFAETIIIPIFGILAAAYSVFKGQLWELNEAEWKED